MSMVISRFSVFILCILFFSNIFITQSSNEINKSLINRTCKKISANTKTISFNFCSTSLQSATTDHCIDVRCLGLVSINLVHDNVTSTRNQIEKFMKNEGLDPFFNSCLGDCFELYSNVISTVNQAMKGYRQKKYGDVNMAITSVMNAATTCENGFREKKRVRSPLTQSNGDAFQLGSIVLAIMSLLQ